MKADDVHATGVQRIAMTGAAQSFIFPVNMKGRFLYFAFRANGSALAYGNVGISQGAQTIVLNQISNAAAGASSAAAGISLDVGEVLDRLPLDGSDRVNFIGNIAAGFAEFYTSEECAPKV
jgi:hypothetical protein